MEEYAIYLHTALSILHVADSIYIIKLTLFTIYILKSVLFSYLLFFVNK